MYIWNMYSTFICCLTYSLHKAMIFHWLNLTITLQHVFSQIHMLNTWMLYVSSITNRHRKVHNIQNTQSYMAERMCSSTLSWTWHYMEVCGHLHTLATLNPGQDPLVSIKQETGWFPHSLWMLWGREKFLAPARHQTLIPQLSSL
jgi:hypothetical protein